jgi:hypothetical protein
MLLVVACSGGGSGGGSAAQTGTITVAITDASIDDWHEVLLEVEAVTLIGPGGQETEVLEPRQTVDLLKLRNVSELLLHRTLTAREITKIRLVLNTIRLNKLDMHGNVTETVSPPVPTQKIDLNPRGRLEIRAGEDLLVMLDVDLENSIKITGTGMGPDEIRFRPLVRLTAGPSGLVRLFGRLDVVTDQICDVSRVSDADGTFEELEICVDLDRMNATYFDVDANRIDFGDIDDMSKVSVYGYYEDTGDGYALAAEIIAVGDRGAFNTFVGPVVDRWDAMTRGFSLGVRDMADPLPVALSDGAKVFDEDGEIIDESAIAMDFRTSARGAWTPDPAALQAFVAFVGDEGVLVGEEGAVLTVEGDTITLENVAMVEVCAITKPATTYFEIVDDTMAGTSTTTRITADQINVDDHIEVNGGGLLGGCIDADTVIKLVTI